MKKIVILGGAGYIGTVLTDLLLKKKFAVVSIDSLKFGFEPIKSFLENRNFRFYKLNTSNSKDIAKIATNSFAVVDLSGLVGDPACSINKKNTLNSNYYNTKKIIDELKGKNIEKFIYASSCSVYGSSVGKQLINEKSKVKPISLYAELKIKCEKYLLSNSRLDFSPTILRLATVFGFSPRQRFDLVINLFTLFSFMGKKIQVFGGEQYRPNVHVYDVAVAILKSIKAKKKLTHKQIFNVGSTTQNKKIKDIAKIIARNHENTKIVVKKSMIDLRDYHIDFSKIKSVLAFNTKFSISSGSKDLFEKLRKNKILRKNLKKYSNYKVEVKKYAKQIKYKKKLK